VSTLIDRKISKPCVLKRAMEEETVSTGPVVETEILETILAKQLSQQEEGGNPLGDEEMAPTSEDANPLLSEDEKRRENANRMMFFLAVGVLGAAGVYGTYKLIKWACTSPAVTEATTQALEEMAPQ